MNKELYQVLNQASKTLDDSIESLEVAALECKAQRDELLEALRNVIRVADRNTVEFDRARAAIAKAEGGK